MKLILFWIISTVELSSCSSLVGFNLYRTNRSIDNPDRDCLHYRVNHNADLDEVLEYCIRTKLDGLSTNNDSRHSSYSFEDLQNLNVTIQELYTWSAPIDLIEDYAEYLENNNVLLKDSKFYNCTFPWFGLYCEYHFSQPNSTFADQLVSDFRAKSSIYIPGTYYKMSCYSHVQCNRTGSLKTDFYVCLDWREICDGKIDCIDGGHDEEHCWQLELNECDNKTEYRCQIGLCIPLAFLNDDPKNTDCLDQSDEDLYTKPLEAISVLQITNCLVAPIFPCEEHMCRPTSSNNYEVHCGSYSCGPLFLQTCLAKRNEALRKASLIGANISEACSYALSCLTGITSIDDIFNANCSKRFYPSYANDIQQYCPTLIRLLPVMFGHIQFVYRNNRSWMFNFTSEDALFNPPDYICFNGTRCIDEMIFNSKTLPVYLFDDHIICRPIQDFQIDRNYIRPWNHFIRLLNILFRQCSSYPQPRLISNYSNVYQCMNSSKFISTDRLIDGIDDCPYKDDESYPFSCSLTNANHRFQCTRSNQTICLARIRVHDIFQQCDNDSNEEYNFGTNTFNETTSFPGLCDGFTLTSVMLIDGRNETDETECDYYPCNNTYTRCDGIWNCFDGADELNCDQPAICPSMHHACLSPITRNFICLPFKRANDGIIDCLGATDEQQFCRSQLVHYEYKSFRCSNSQQCIHSFDICELACSNPENTSTKNCTNDAHALVLQCFLNRPKNRVNKFFCLLGKVSQLATAHLALNISSSFIWPSSPRIEREQQLLHSSFSQQNPLVTIVDKPSTNVYLTVWSCYRGIAIQRLFSSQSLCLCPPAYYGRRCEYQNQRVSLSVQIQVSSNWHSVLIVIVTLRDQEQNQIESFDKFNYLPLVDCRKKFNIYLLYNSRPKNLSRKYFVRIDIYKQSSFEHQSSWQFPILFSFLPVYRISARLEKPLVEDNTVDCLDLLCGEHGHCRKYVNTNASFCLCDRGWSGFLCNTEHTCRCSNDSLCLASNLCLCSIGKFGNRCYLRYSTCSCLNNGTCIQTRDHLNLESTFQCACIEGFSGPRCEIIDTKVVLSFESDLDIPRYIYAHFIQVFDKNTPYHRSTRFKKIPLNEYSVTIYKSTPFHIIFVETEDGRYYLAVLQLIYNPLITIETSLTRSKQCLPINKLFNSTFVRMHYFRRWKYYHLPCKQHANLECFYDHDDQMCLCNHELQQANCFHFNRTINETCRTENLCENQAQCFQDNPNCPTPFVCVCDDCSYGSRCQLSTKSYRLSLDIILGYQIRPNVPFNQQRSVIKVTTAVVTVLVAFGLINGLLSVLTFQSKEIRRIDSGYYLFISSTVSIFVTVLFAFKFFSLIHTQISSSIDRFYVLFNCKTLEFLLRIFIAISSWLNACVGVNRALISSKPIQITNKTLNQRKTKSIVFTICLVTVLTHIQDPIFRRLIDDVNEGRTWCIPQYPSSIQTFDSVILICHFLLPFIFNIFSAMLIIRNITRHRSAAKSLSYRSQLRKQFVDHKHLFIAPVIFILLALPQLIISFISNCMKSPRNPWLYLFSNFLSYIPSMLTFLVFVLPSDNYINEFKNTVTRLRKYTRR